MSMLVTIISVLEWNVVSTEDAIVGVPSIVLLDFGLLFPADSFPAEKYLVQIHPLKT